MKRELTDRPIKSENGVALGKTVYESLSHKAERYLDVPAIEYFTNQLSYRALFDEVGTYSKAFLRLGVQTGTVVTLCMPSIPSFIVMYYALNRIGAIANCVSFAFLKHDLQRYTDDKKSSVLVILDKFLMPISSAVEDTQLKTIIVAHISDYMPQELQRSVQDVELSQIRASLPSSVRCMDVDSFRKLGYSNSISLTSVSFDKERDAAYLYTSGTTGLFIQLFYQQTPCLAS